MSTINPSAGIEPRFVSLKELRDKMLPRLNGWSWAEDAIVDLWKLGAPAPNDSVCPMQPHCPDRECPHVKRLLLPTQFAKWWGEVAAREGYELSALQAATAARLQRAGRIKL